MIANVVNISQPELNVETNLSNNIQTEYYSPIANNLSLRLVNSPVANLTLNVIGSPVTALTFNEQIETILKWGSARKSKTVCVANVHMLMEAFKKSNFASVLRNASMVTPDGMPLVWMMKLLGAVEQDRVAGMDILLSLCNLAPQQNVKLFFLGSDAETLGKMQERLDREFPHLQVAGMLPLPFRPLTPEEDVAVIEQIHQSGAGIVLVSLGCPKQELWMNEHKNRIQAVMIGLGGAFPVFAGIQKRAPEAVRNLGLEWFYRLIQEPKRLWSRYADTIPPFIWLALKQLVALKLRVTLEKSPLVRKLYQSRELTA